MKTSFLILLALLTASSLVRSQQPAGTWRHFINSTNPRDMIADGPYLWIATDGGLVKFSRDSGTFILYTTDNSGLPDNALFRLMIDRQHGLWVSTQSQGGAIARLQNGTWTIFNNNNSPLPPPGNGAYIPVCDSLGRIWVATSIGLLKYDGGMWTTYDMSNSPMSDSYLEAITSDRIGNIWIGCQYKDTTKDRGRILKFDGNSKWEIHNDTLDAMWIGDTLYPEMYPDNPWSMFVDDSNNLFVGYAGFVQRLIPGTGWDTYNIMPSFPYGGSNYVLSLQQIGGYIWASNEVTTVRFSDTLLALGSPIEYSPYRGGFPFYGASAVVGVDSELWFAGNGGGGLARYKDSAWTIYSNLSNNSLTANQLEKATCDSKGRVWFSQGVNSGQLSAFEGNVWQNFDTVLHGLAAKALCADSSGNIWIGTTGNGVIKFDGIHAQYFDLNKLADISNVISSLAFDKRGILWIGTQFQNSGAFASGLVKFDGTNWRTYTHSNTPLPEYDVLSLAVDTSGVIWIGDPSSGIATLDDTGHWTLINSSNSAFPSFVAEAITIAPNGDVWVATDKGPSKWDGKSWTTYTSGTLGGLSGCAVDAYGHVWFSSYDSGPDDGGACEFDGKSWTNYTPANSAIGSGYEWTVISDRQGNLWFATDGQGVVEYVPSTPASVTTLTLNTTSSLAIYPNPTTNLLHIESTANDIVITDLLGRTRMRAVAGDGVIDVSSLPQGVYSIGDGTSRARFVKE